MACGEFSKAYFRQIFYEIIFQFAKRETVPRVIRTLCSLAGKLHAQLDLQFTNDNFKVVKG
jgi:hypothetical protein